MRYAVEYRLAGKLNGVVIFNAEDEDGAAAYVADLIVNHNYTLLSDPQPLPNGIFDLYRLFPRNTASLLERARSHTV